MRALVSTILATFGEHFLDAVDLMSRYATKLGLGKEPRSAGIDDEDENSFYLQD